MVEIHISLAAINLGSNPALAIKNNGDANFEREAFVPFDLSAIDIEAREVTLLAADDVVNARWLKWVADFQLGRKRLLDTLIAVTWHAAGVGEICTLNPRDFKVFDVLQIHCIGTEKSSA